MTSFISLYVSISVSIVSDMPAYLKDRVVVQHLDNEELCHRLTHSQTLSRHNLWPKSNIQRL